jgi:hypothetical protein
LLLTEIQQTKLVGNGTAENVALPAVTRKGMSESSDGSCRIKSCSYTKKKIEVYSFDIDIMVCNVKLQKLLTVVKGLPKTRRM